MYWYLKVLKQYSDFNGRARRTEIWMFTFFNMIFIIIYEDSLLIFFRNISERLSSKLASLWGDFYCLESSWIP